MALLEIENLQVHFDTDDGVVRAVDGLTYTVDRGQTLGIVGESGLGQVRLLAHRDGAVALAQRPHLGVDQVRRHRS